MSNIIAYVRRENNRGGNNLKEGRAGGRRFFIGNPRTERVGVDAVAFLGMSGTANGKVVRGEGMGEGCRLLSPGRKWSGKVCGGNDRAVPFSRMIFSRPRKGCRRKSADIWVILVGMVESMLRCDSARLTPG